MPKRAPPSSINQTAIGNENIQVVGSNNVINRITKIFHVDTEQQRAQRNRRNMLELVENTWIKGVLEKSLYSQILIDLGMEDRIEQVDHPWGMLLQTTNEPDQTLPSNTSMSQIFEESNGALLILGEPGSGKTTMLLELAREAIADARDDSTLPIPVIFNLSSWSHPKRDITNWLVDELITKYYVSEKLAKGWVANDELLLLLDGLDEVKAEYRDSCVEAINRFRKEHGSMPLAICSRISEYQTLALRLKLQRAVVIQSLTISQIKSFFERGGANLSAIYKFWQEDVALQELMQTPLMLNIVVAAFRGGIENLLTSEQHKTIEISQKNLFDLYIRRMFERSARTKDELYSREQTKHWLAWLAKGMIKHRQTTFLVETLHQNWLPTRAQEKLYEVTFGLVFGLVFGPLLGIYLATFRESQREQFDRFLLGFGIGLIGGFLPVMLGKGYGYIHPTKGLLQSINWSWRTIWLRKRYLFFVFLPITLLMQIFLKSLGMGGWVFELSFWLSFALLGCWFFGLNAKKLETTTFPNQGIRESLKGGIVVGLSFIIILLLVISMAEVYIYNTWGEFGVDQGLIRMGLGAIIYGIVWGFTQGGRIVLSHYLLRLFLYSKGCMPLNYIQFLDFAAERIFLRKVGGGYIFIHRLLMEHFASLEHDET